MNDRLSISQQLQRRRKELGLSLSDLALRADTSAATLSRYENGWTRFETNTLRKLASALGCELQIVLCPRTSIPQVRGKRGAAVKRLARLFWDHRLVESDFDKHPAWILERVLDYGNLDDIRLLQSLMGRAQFLQNTAMTSRLLPRTAGLWHGILKREGVICTRKYSRNTAWNY